jgi:putative chitinase
MSAGQVLQALVISAIMGMIGQGIRAVVGLKSAATLAAQSGSQQSEFDAAYFFLSLMIGAVAGIIAGFGLGLKVLLDTLASDQKVLLALAASGYAGADFIENAMTTFLPSTGGSTKTPTDGDTTAKKPVSPDPGPPPTAASVRQTSQSALAVVSSMKTALEALGSSPVALLQQATSGNAKLQNQLNAATAAYASMKDCVEKTQPIVAAVTALTNLPDNASADTLRASNQAAKDGLDSASSLNNDFNAALSAFNKNYNEIAQTSAKG